MSPFQTKPSPVTDLSAPSGVDSNQLTTDRSDTGQPDTGRPDTGRPYAGQSREQRSAQRQQQFLAAGLEVFGTDGFRHTTVKSLCRTAQLTDRYFYQEFGSLEGLLQAVYCQQMERIYRLLEEEFQRCVATDNLAQLVRNSLQLFFTELEDPRVARVCMLELEGVSADTDALYLSYIQRFARQLTDVLQTLRQAKDADWQISEEEAELLGTGLVGAMRQITTSWLLSNYAYSRDLMVSSGERIILGLMSQLN
ncbi:MAG: TetR family transcriptional regulator [Oceanospirillaceae bacterium]|nr:TetR family transcriptional regulator [Oceanospirillaceae bacterium]MAY01136.1 TetR family transcriptional regulator [Oceanospirillaceae bacterium]MBL36466.1 TetR family transcriptional regulator [Oceanospirillaceae bacterium]MBS52169.1 TetR family transcriptional regulator [Oceanospirillaceae bacterium]|tara:strand:- start:1275 stop:2030 length:756 start_codon:yes stop_codon:yes gene_type:complete